MGMLSSFLCCGTADAKDDSDDKYHKQTTRRVASAPSKVGSSKPSSAARDAKRDVKSEAQVSTKAATSKPTLDDDPSVNEGDTIANNENNNNNNIGEVPKPIGSAGKEDVSKDVVTEHVKVDHDKVVPAEEAEVSPLASDPAKPESVEEAAESGELGDLSKIQDGQSFNPETGFLLGRKDIQRFGTKKCLILDLDETLVHSSFKYLRTADFVIPVEIDDQIQHVYVIKRPGVDEFLRKVGQWYEVVVFTASVAKYGDPLLNRLDISKSIHYRLFRDSCYNYQGNFIKNLSQIGRPLSESIIIDNSPASYMFHPSHALPISSWFSDTHDNELLDLLPILEDLSKQNVDDVSLVLDVAI